jgi:hypothetical protein
MTERSRRAGSGSVSSVPVARKSFNLSQVSDLMPLVRSRQSRVNSKDGPDDLLWTQDSRLSTRGSGLSGRHDLSGCSMTCWAGEGAPLGIRGRMYRTYIIYVHLYLLIVQNERIALRGLEPGGAHRVACD